MFISTPFLFFALAYHILYTLYRVLRSQKIWCWYFSGSIHFKGLWAQKSDLATRSLPTDTFVWCSGVSRPGHSILFSVFLIFWNIERTIQSFRFWLVLNLGFSLRENTDSWPSNRRVGRYSPAAVWREQAPPCHLLYPFPTHLTLRDSFESAKMFLAVLCSLTLRICFQKTLFTL